MSQKISVQDLIVTYGEKVIDYEKYAREMGKPVDYLLEVSFLDVEDGKVAFYPGVLYSNGALIDRTTANSMKNIITYLSEKGKSAASMLFSMEVATIVIKGIPSDKGYFIYLSIDVEGEFFWEVKMNNHEAFLVAEAVGYALDQYEASIVGEEAQNTANQANRLLAEKNKPLGLDERGVSKMIPQAIPAGDDWGSES